MVHLDLWKGPSNQESLELSFEPKKSIIHVNAGKQIHTQNAIPLL